MGAVRTVNTQINDLLFEHGRNLHIHVAGAHMKTSYFGTLIVSLSFLGMTACSNSALQGTDASNGDGPTLMAPGGISEAVSAPPVITTQPKSQSLKTGQQLGNTVTATGSGLSYQWYKDGVAMPAQKVYVMYLASVTAADAGRYYVIVRNSAGSVTSQTVTITVDGSGAGTGNLPVITTQPVTQQVQLGKQFSLVSSATSSSALSYQWYKNGIAMPGQTYNMIYVAAAQVGDAGQYQVEIRNAAGSVTSAMATITISGGGTTISAPTIQTQPQASTASATAAAVSLDVGRDYLYIFMEAAGAGLSYQWYRNGARIAGSDKALWFNPAQSSEVGQYYVVVSNSAGSVQSQIVTVSAKSSTPVPQPQPQQPSPSTSPMALGACGSCIGGPDGITRVQQMEAFMGRSVDYVLVWGWGPKASDFEYSFKYLSQLWPTKYKLHWSVPMVFDFNIKFSDILAGTYDNSYRIAAQTIAARDPNGIIRMGHEMNGNWYPWGMNVAGNAAEYAATYRHIVDIFRSVSPGFKFDWNPGIGKWAGLDCLTTYPGDTHVDYITFDMYEDKKWTDPNLTPDQRWNNMLEVDGRGLNWLVSFAAAHGKKIGFNEWASDIDDGVLITRMAKWMKDNGVVFQMYWNSDAAFSGSFETNPTNGSVYKQLFGQ